MKAIHFLILLLAAAALCAQTAQEQPAALNVPDSLHVGERFTLMVTHTAPADSVVTPPALGTVNQFELLDIEHTHKRDGDNTRHTWVLTLAAFDTGALTVPPLAFAWNGGSYVSEPQQVNVLSVLTPTSTLGDIAAPVPLRPRFWDYALPLLALAVLAAGAWYVRRRLRRPAMPDIGPVDNRPAWIVALEMLASLRGSGYLEHDEMVAWYFGLSYVLRTFLERYSGINAVEMTTGEIAAALPELPMRQKALDYLRAADGIKFARRKPPAGEASAAADWLQGYLESFEKAEEARLAAMQPQAAGEAAHA